MKPLSLLQKKLFQTLKKEKGLCFIIPLLKKHPETKIYLVGGIIRDWLLKRESNDYDFVVCGLPAKKLEAFLKTQGQVNLVGRRFGVFKFTPKVKNKQQAAPAIDIALPRTERAWGTGGYRDVETQSDWQLPIEEDLGRRDFTINAIGLRITNFYKYTNLIDPFGGLKDIKKRIIRTVGKPEERFKEDYSRMLRALRFACQLNFGIEKKTWTAMKKMMKKINTLNALNTLKNKPERVVPCEVIAKEFLKSLMAEPARTLDLWDQAGVFKCLMPELLKMKKCPQPKEFHAEGDVWIHTRLALANLTNGHFKKFCQTLPLHLKKEPRLSTELVLATLFHDIGKPRTLKTPEKHGVDRIRTDEHDRVGAALAKKIGSRLRLNSSPDLPCDLDKVAWLIERHLLTVHGDPGKFTNRTIEKYFFNPKNPGGDLLKLIYADQMASLINGKPQLGALPRLIRRIKQLPKKLRQKNRLPRPLLNGDEIMKILKIKPGIQVGKIIEKLREAQLAGEIKTKKEATSFLI